MVGLERVCLGWRALRCRAGVAFLMDGVRLWVRARDGAGVGKGEGEGRLESVGSRRCGAGDGVLETVQVRWPRAGDGVGDGAGDSVGEGHLETALSGGRTRGGVVQEMA